MVNFGASCGRADGLLGLLLLAQGTREKVFEALTSAGQVGEWRMAPVAGEPQTLIARRGPISIAVVCGRQVRADDGLEVLALGTEEQFADGRSFREVLDAVRRSGALAVIPWGLGKWTGRRGRNVAATMEALSDMDVFLGDNGSRFGWLPLPKRLAAGEARGFRILPGSDPFPFGADHRRVGGFGFFMDEPPNEAAPWGRLHAWLRERRGSPATYGRACGPLRFLVNQAGIQAWNRLGFAKHAS